MPETYVIKDQYASYFLTFQVLGWVDLFTRKRYRDIVVDAFNYCITNQHLQVHAWVIMSNHVHCILSSKNGTLSDAIRDLKRYTAKSILHSIMEEGESRKEWMLYQFSRAARQHVRNGEYQLWTHENHAIQIDPFIKGMSDSKLDYIHENPVQEGWVEGAEEYLYSSARDYAGNQGLIKLDMW